MLWFDVEDYVTAESDSAFLELLKMLERTGVKATIKFCAQKLELLRTRGETEILRLLAQHEMSFHTTNHSVHPLPSEYLNNYSFKDGASEFERREEAGFNLIRAISGQRETSYGQPGEAWAPHVFPVLRKWGIPTYLDAHPIIGIEGRPFWFGGILSHSKLSNLMRLEHTPNGFEKLKERFINRNMNGEDIVFVSIYDHPTEFCTTEFWDEVNFKYGKNPAFLTPASLRETGEQSSFIKMLEDFIHYTMTFQDVEYITALESMAFERTRRRPILVDDIKAYAKIFNGNIDFEEIAGGWLTPSEIFSLFSRFLSNRVLTPELFYGPESMEESLFYDSHFDVKQLANAAYEQYDCVLGYKQLKPLYRVEDSFISPVDLLAMMIQAVKKEQDIVPKTMGVFSAKRYVDESYRFGGNWILWEPQFKGEGIIRHTQLQTWTLKPASY